MATFKASIGVDLSGPQELGFLIDLTDHPPLVTPSAITIEAVTDDAVEILLNVAGRDFGKDGLGHINGGTIEGIEVVVNGRQAYEFTGLSIAILPFIEQLKSNAGDIEGEASQRLLGGVDTVIGSNQKDVLLGFAGIDDLRGRKGADRLFGGDDADFLNGGRGKDRLTGGDDADTFVFAALGRKHADIVTDLEIGVDHIAFDRHVFKRLHGVGAEGAVDPDQIHIGHRAAKAGHRIIVDDEEDKLLYDPDGAGGQRQILVAKFKGVIEFQDGNDIFLVLA